MRKIITYSFLFNQGLINFRKRNLVWKKFYIFVLFWPIESLWPHFYHELRIILYYYIICKFYKIFF